MGHPAFPLSRQRGRHGGVQGACHLRFLETATDERSAPAFHPGQPVVHERLAPDRGVATAGRRHSAELHPRGRAAQRRGCQNSHRAKNSRANRCPYRRISRRRWPLTPTRRRPSMPLRPVAVANTSSGSPAPNKRRRARGASPPRWNGWRKANSATGNTSRRVDSVQCAPFQTRYTGI